ncbi:DUF2007 domain-containing protein [Rhizobium sp. L1K21]|uniref:putative signal transducing protein n=1 Tax=Rhizobium sp. L1K21 TaxID=2954933 RepID=UPI002091FD30|nr:DUF2007 domain-containing protein [Rhizobium sp. L1K21]MCO6186923.1 DUF2007 domain-containing protein [Rhizobium sp. L1K21]
MLEIVRSNDAVLLSLLESLMKEAGIACMIADQGMSILEGSLGAIPRRFMVDAERVDEARAIVRDAGLEAELREEKE